MARLVAPQPESDEFTATAQLLRRSALDGGNIDGLRNWWLYRLLHSANPLAEKMCLFWHDHFATSNAKVRDAGMMDAQHALIRGHALGSFAGLFRGMARDPAMLVWLDGNANRKRHPNENFAREVMELFSLGVGNYSETDIREAARAFTGWHLRNDKFWFNTVQHDPGTKSVLGKSGRFKGGDILEICLAHEACPRFLAAKMLRAFVKPAPERALVDALAARIRHHDFELAPVLRELLSSRAFFAADARRSLIKSPVELVVGAHRSLKSVPRLDNCAQLLGSLGQSLFEPPTVKGWEGGRLWINSATMLQRANFAAELAGGDRYGRSLDLPSHGSAEDTVDHYVELLLATDLSEDTRAGLHACFEQARGSASDRARGLVHHIMSLPEYQLL